MNIVRGVQKTGVKVVLYGPEGVGKSTFASMTTRAVFIDTEGGTKFMDVARVDGVKSWADIVGAVDWFIQHPDELRTLVIDTIDWAERYAAEQVCIEKKWTSLEDAGYGKGYVFLKQKVQELLEKLNLLAAKGVNIVLLAHSIIKKFEQPDEMGAYDRYTLKLNERNVAPLVKEWSDMLLFVNFRTDVVKGSDGKTMKARGGQKRILYANHTAAWDAKNRFGLPDEMPFEYEAIAPILESAEAAPVPKQTMEEVLANSIDLPEPKAEVTKVGTVPAAEKPKKGKKQSAPPPERPEDMTSENPEKDAALKRLWDKMIADGVYDSLVLMAVVAEKDYYDITVKPRDYDLDFINDVLIEAWEQVNSMCQTKIHDLPF